MPGVSKYSRLLLGPFFLAVLSAVVKVSVESTAKDGQVSLSVWGPLNRVAIWIGANGIGLVGWVLAATLILMFALAYRDERRQRPARILEHYFMHLAWARSAGLRDASSQEDLTQALRIVEKLRGDLLNLTPSIFSQATAESFRSPAFVHLGEARKLVAGMSHQDFRETLIARCDQLMDAVKSKWIAYDGHKIDHPSS